jgi:enoyl-CoA hydratase/carnithine racemase
MSSELLSERRGATLVLTISDPATRNTLSTQVIAAGIEGARRERIQGRGSRRGAARRRRPFLRRRQPPGLLERRAAGRPVQHRMIEHLHDFITAIRAYPKPVIAAVEGAAAGAGFSLALACDLIVASAEARFVVSHGKVGLSPTAAPPGCSAARCRGRWRSNSSGWPSRSRPRR